MRLQLTGLWQHSGFRKLWLGQTVSAIGSQVTGLALPLVAVLVLEATPAQMGVLGAVGSLPALALALFAGVWVDRVRRRPLLIATDLARAALIGTVPLAAALGLLRVEHLYLVALGAGGLSLVYGLAHQAYLPSLIGRESLMDGYGKLELSRSAAEIVGPGLAGSLVQAVTAPLALVVDALSFVASALFVASIGASEPPVEGGQASRSLLGDIREGLVTVVQRPLLRSFLASDAVATTFNSMLEAVYILYITRGLHIGAGLLGLAFSAGGLGFLFGAAIAPRVAKRIGVGPAAIVGLTAAAIGDAALPLARGSLPVVVTILVAGQVLFGMGVTILSVGRSCVVQGATPTRLRGRVGATRRFLAAALGALGALLGGALGQAVGLRPLLLLAVAGELLAAACLALSPVRSQRLQPDAGE